MIEVHGLGSSSYEHLPFGGHGQSGPTIDTFRGAGLDIPLYRGRASKSFDPTTNAKIRRRVHFAVACLFAAVSGVFLAVGVLLSL